MISVYTSIWDFSVASTRHFGTTGRCLIESTSYICASRSLGAFCRVLLIYFVGDCGTSCGGESTIDHANILVSDWAELIDDD